MAERIPPARPLSTLRGRGLKGRFRTPAEPAVMALALLLATVARGETVLYADTSAAGADIEAALRVAAAIGARPERHDDRWHVNGLGALGLLEPEGPLDFSGAGRALPLAMGLLGPYRFTSRFVAEAGRRQPVRPGLGDALRGLGVEVEDERTGQLPATLRGPRSVVPALWRAPAAIDDDCVTAMLLAGLALPGVSTLKGIARPPHRAIRLLRHFGTEITIEGETLLLRGMPALGARTFAVAGDPRLAGFAVLAGLLVPDSDLVVENVAVDDRLRAVIQTLNEMGGSIEIVEPRQVAGEQVVDIKVRHSPLLGLAVKRDRLTAATLPLLAVAGAFAAGETLLPRTGAPGEGELHRRLADALVENGARARADVRGLVVGRPPPGGRLGGGTIAADAEPDFAAAFLIFGLAATREVTLADSRAMETALPLVTGLAALGGEFYRRRPG